MPDPFRGHVGKFVKIKPIPDEVLEEFRVKYKKTPNFFKPPEVDTDGSY